MVAGSRSSGTLGRLQHRQVVLGLQRRSSWPPTRGRRRRSRGCAWRPRTTCRLVRIVPLSMITTPVPTLRSMARLSGRSLASAVRRLSGRPRAPPSGPRLVGLLAAAEGSGSFSIDWRTAASIAQVGTGGVVHPRGRGCQAGSDSSAGQGQHSRRREKRWRAGCAGHELADHRTRFRIGAVDRRAGHARRCARALGCSTVQRHALHGRQLLQHDLRCELQGTTERLGVHAAAAVGRRHAAPPSPRRCAAAALRPAGEVTRRSGARSLCRQRQMAGAGSELVSSGALSAGQPGRVHPAAAAQPRPRRHLAHP